MKKLIPPLIGFVLLSLVLGYYFGFDIGYEKSLSKNISNYEECVKAGNIVLESYPPQCRTKDGRSFSEEIGNELEKRDLILIENPRPNEQIKNPLFIKGQARGNWFFEATFPVKLQDDQGNFVAEGFATAKGEWMTEEFVPFEAEITYDAANIKKGKLILEKSNPSGLEENADQLIVPVRF